MEIPRFFCFFPMFFYVSLLVKSEIPIFLENPKEKLQQLVEQVELKVQPGCISKLRQFFWANLTFFIIKHGDFTSKNGDLLTIVYLKPY